MPHDRPRAQYGLPRRIGALTAIRGRQGTRDGRDARPLPRGPQSGSPRLCRIDAGPGHALGEVDALTAIAGELAFLPDARAMKVEPIFIPYGIPPR